MRRCCLIHLKNSSTCRRLLYSAEYHPPMQVVKGTVVGGKVVLDHGALPEGAEVGVFVTREEGSIRLSPTLQRELEAALDEADREEGIAAEELFAELRKYG